MVRIKADGLFRDLPNLIKADLRRNKIAVIDNGAFEGANTLLELYIFPFPSGILRDPFSLIRLV